MERIINTLLILFSIVQYSEASKYCEAKAAMQAKRGREQKTKGKKQNQLTPTCQYVQCMQISLICLQPQAQAQAHLHPHPHLNIVNNNPYPPHRFRFFQTLPDEHVKLGYHHLHHPPIFIKFIRFLLFFYTFIAKKHFVIVKL